MKKINYRLKIGDKIKIIAGNQKGLLGTITSIDRKTSSVIIDNVLPRIRFMKNRQGGEAEKKTIQLPIHISNVMLWDKDANICSKIQYKIINDKKCRVFKKSGNILESQKL
jgi:large subunit ribosomal protein L24